MRPFESSTVTLLDKLIEKTPLLQIGKILCYTIEHLNNSELAADLKRVQHRMQSIGNECRGMANEYRH